VTRASGAAGRLLALMGAGSLALLVPFIAVEESGRRVEVAVTGSGAGATVAVRHVSGRQYLAAYLDAAGVATACDGITRGVKLGQRYTEAQCADLLIGELLEHAEQVRRCSPGLFTAGMEYARVAAVSLAYNIGWPSFCGSTANRLFKAGQLAAACDWILPWNKARVRGRLTVLNGLRKRRAKEREICLTGTPGHSPLTLRARIEAVR
jgi:lysozyme